MTHITHIQYRRDGILHSVMADVLTDDIEAFRKECMEHYNTDIVYLLTKKRINYDKRRD